ncbi:MAG TPA: hypothetical protein VND93_19915, partial [Myxococcales bacterium]|nr:hypothetical protein [Myxococcales bacterium]
FRSTFALGAAVAAAAASVPARGGVDLTPGLKVGVEERYDDDALLAAAGAGQLTTKVSPKLGLDVRGHTFESSGWYAADLQLRHQSGSFTVDHRAKAQAQVHLTERAWMDGAVSAWRVTDPTSLPRLGMARTLSPVLYGRAAAGAHYEVTERWTAGLEYAFEGAQIYDGRSGPGVMHSPAAEAWYRLSRITDLGMELRLQQFIFSSESAGARSAAVTLRHRFTRLTHLAVRAGAGLYQGQGDLQGSPYPRAQLELGRDGERVDLMLVLGHDLMGASGFTAAIWADYGSALVDWRIAEPLKVYTAGNVYRNGRAPNLGLWPPGAPGSSQGYGVTAGLEWKVGRALALKVQGDHYAQIGAPAAGAVDLSRNVISARLELTPFDWAPGRGW